MPRTSSLAILLSACSLLQLSCGTGVDPNGSYLTQAVTDVCASLLAASPWSGVAQFGIVSKTTSLESSTTDTSGRIYITGQVEGALDAATNGAASLGTSMYVAQYSAGGTRQWVRQLGAASGTGSVAGIGVAVDSSSNTYVAGYTTVGLGGNTLTGTLDAFLAKYDSSGVKQWVRQTGVATKDVVVRGFGIDSSANVYLTGYTTGSLDGVTLTGTSDLFLVKYDSSGTKLWTKLLGANAAGTSGWGIATDSSSNVYVVGSTNGNIGNAPVGANDLLLVKYDSSGTRLWAKQLGTASATIFGRRVEVDREGNPYVTGNTNGGIAGVALSGTQDLFIIKYDSSGSRQWAKLLGVSTYVTYGLGLAIGASNDVYVSGYSTGAVADNNLTGNQDSLIVKYDSSGARQWVKLFGVDAKSTTGKSVSLDCAGNPWVAGYTTGGLAGNSVTGTQDVFISKYTSAGARL